MSQKKKSLNKNTLIQSINQSQNQLCSQENYENSTDEFEQNQNSQSISLNSNSISSKILKNGEIFQDISSTNNTIENKHRDINKAMIKNQGSNSIILIENNSQSSDQSFSQQNLQTKTQNFLKKKDTSQNLNGDKSQEKNKIQNQNQSKNESKKQRKRQKKAFAISSTCQYKAERQQVYRDRQKKKEEFLEEKVGKQFKILMNNLEEFVHEKGEFFVEQIKKEYEDYQAQFVVAKLTKRIYKKREKIEKGDQEYIKRVKQQRRDSAQKSREYAKAKMENLEKLSNNMDLFVPYDQVFEIKQEEFDDISLTSMKKSLFKQNESYVISQDQISQQNPGKLENKSKQSKKKNKNNNSDSEQKNVIKQRQQSQSKQENIEFCNDYQQKQNNDQNKLYVEKDNFFQKIEEENIQIKQEILQIKQDNLFINDKSKEDDYFNQQENQHSQDFQDEQDDLNQNEMFEDTQEHYIFNNQGQQNILQNKYNYNNVNEQKNQNFVNQKNIMMTNPQQIFFDSNESQLRKQYKEYLDSQKKENQNIHYQNQYQNQQHNKQIDITGNQNLVQNNNVNLRLEIQQQQNNQNFDFGVNYTHQYDLNGQQLYQNLHQNIEKLNENQQIQQQIQLGYLNQNYIQSDNIFLDQQQQLLQQDLFQIQNEEQEQNNSFVLLNKNDKNQQINTNINNNNYLEKDYNDGQILDEEQQYFNQNKRQYFDIDQKKDVNFLKNEDNQDQEINDGIKNDQQQQQQKKLEGKIESNNLLNSQFQLGNGNFMLLSFTILIGIIAVIGLGQSDNNNISSMVKDWILERVEEVYFLYPGKTVYQKKTLEIGHLQLQMEDLQCFSIVPEYSPQEYFQCFQLSLKQAEIMKQIGNLTGFMEWSDQAVQMQQIGDYNTYGTDYQISPYLLLQEAYLRDSEFQKSQIMGIKGLNVSLSDQEKIEMQVLFKYASFQQQVTEFERRQLQIMEEFLTQNKDDLEKEIDNFEELDENYNNNQYINYHDQVIEKFDYKIHIQGMKNSLQTLLKLSKNESYYLQRGYYYLADMLFKEDQKNNKEIVLNILEKLINSLKMSYQELSIDFVDILKLKSKVLFRAFDEPLSALQIITEIYFLEQEILYPEAQSLQETFNLRQEYIQGLQQTQRENQDNNSYNEQDLFEQYLHAQKNWANTYQRSTRIKSRNYGQ